MGEVFKGAVFSQKVPYIEKQFLLSPCVPPGLPGHASPSHQNWLKQRKEQGRRIGRGSKRKFREAGGKDIQPQLSSCFCLCSVAREK